MARIAARLAAVAVTASLTVGMTACSQVNDAVDCAGLVPVITEVSNNVTSDTETLTASTEKLRTEAETIDDAELKQAALDYADEAEQANALINGDAAAAAETNLTAVEDAFNTLTDICGSLAE